MNSIHFQLIRGEATLELQYLDSDSNLLLHLLVSPPKALKVDVFDLVPVAIYFTHFYFIPPEILIPLSLSIHQVGCEIIYIQTDWM